MLRRIGLRPGVMREVRSNGHVARAIGISADARPSATGAVLLGSDHVSHRISALGSEE
jgi:hypothetical protein